MNRNRGMIRSTFLLLFTSFLLAGTPCTADAQTGGRYALLIGNSRYLTADPVSGVKDAKLMASHLKSLGFEDPELILNGDRKAIKNGLAKLGTKIPGASAVVIFFSGHGFQRGGKNYLMPTDGTIDPARAISLEDIQRTLALAPDAVKLVFLDACRNVKGLDSGLNTTETPSLKKTLYSFAAGPGQLSAAGSPDGYSPYSMALLRHLREPGLNVIDLLGKVSADLEGFDQVPAFVVNDQADDFTGFYLQPPVVLQAEIGKADDSLLVLLNGNVAMSGGPSTKGDLRLKAGENKLELMIYNERVLHNGQTWGRTEGWSYELAIKHKGQELGCGQPRCFEDGEEVPFKNGPRHGKVFTVARANLFVSLDSPTVAVKDLDLRVWERDAPAWANNQKILSARSLTQLELSPEELFNDVNLGRWAALRPVLVEFLRTGRILGQVVTDPNGTVFTVYGNRRLETFVETCMTDPHHRPDRVRALKASIQQAIDRRPTPFLSYDQDLMECVREVGEDSGMRREDMRVWTAVETRSSLDSQSK